MPPVLGPGRRRRCACSRARAPSASPLAVAEREQRQLLADQALLDDGARARAEAALDEDVPQRGLRLLGVVGHRHALAGGEPVGLDHHAGSASSPTASIPSLQRAHVTPAGGRHAGLVHRLLGERLRALQAGRGGARAERAIAARIAGASTRPATSGTSGPTTVRWTPSRSTAATSPSTSSAATSSRRASWAMPALPGAHSSSVAPAERASARTIACSRPPPPTTRTFKRSSSRASPVRAQRDAMKSSTGIAASVS